MAIIDLKSDLSQIRVKVKRNLTDTTLPRTNMRDASGNIEIKYDEKNKFQVPLDRSNSDLEIHWDRIKDSYYARGLSNEDTLGYRNNDRFGFDQPYVIREIGDKWGPDGISSWDMGIIRGGAAVAADRTLMDEIRIGKFLGSPKGAMFAAKQAGLQILNVGGDLGTRANIYNPTSIFSSLPQFVHTNRHSDKQPQSDLIRIGLSNLVNKVLPEINGIKGIKFSDHRDARYKGVVGQVIKHGKLNVFKDEQKQVKAIGEQGKTVIEAGAVKKLNRGYSVGTRLADNLKSGDRVNLVPYGSKTDKELKESENSDFVPFRFKDVNNNKYIIFRALLSGITDNMTPEFAAERYVGRPDQVYVYQGTNREISFTFDVYPKTRQELPVLWEKLNYLVGLVYPSWAKTQSNGLGMIAPFIELTIGDMYKDTPGFLSQLSLTVQDGTTWEIDDWKLRKYIQANCSFTYIGKYLPNQVGKHYELPWLYDYSDGRGTFISNPDTEKYPFRRGNTHELFAELGQSTLGGLIPFNSLETLPDLGPVTITELD